MKSHLCLHLSSGRHHKPQKMVDFPGGGGSIYIYIYIHTFKGVPIKL